MQLKLEFYFLPNLDSQIADFPDFLPLLQRNIIKFVHKSVFNIKQDKFVLQTEGSTSQSTVFDCLGTIQHTKNERQRRVSGLYVLMYFVHKKCSPNNYINYFIILF